jgi:hypothetical protein
MKGIYFHTMIPFKLQGSAYEVDNNGESLQLVRTTVDEAICNTLLQRVLIGVIATELKGSGPLYRSSMSVEGHMDLAVCWRAGDNYNRTATTTPKKNRKTKPPHALYRNLTRSRPYL